MDNERCDCKCGLELKVGGKYLIKISMIKLYGALESPAVAHYAISFGELGQIPLVDVKGCQWIGMQGLGSRVNIGCPTSRSAHCCRSNSNPLRPRCVTWVQTKREGVHVKSGRSGALKPDRLGLSYEAPKYSDDGTG